MSEPRKRGRPPLPPDQRKPPKSGPRTSHGTLPTPEEHSAAKARLVTLAAGAGYRMDPLVPGWQPAVAQLLGVSASMVRAVWQGRRKMPARWREW